ncbi:hypothetical protein D3C78_507610 [compost metagenome]
MQGLALVLEDLLACHVLGLQYAALGRAVHVFDQVARQLAGQQGLLLLDEGAGGSVGQVLDSLAAQDRQLAPPGVAWAELTVGFRQVIADQVEQQRFDFGVLQQLHFQAVFQVDQRVADVIRSLHQVDQRVARPALVFQLRQAELAGDLFEQRQFALVTAELVLLVAQGVGVACAPWVLQVSTEGGIGQPGTAVELVVLQLGEYPKALGVAFEVEEVGALVVAHVVQPATPGGLLEPVADGVFARVAERWVADVMGQAGRLHDHPQVAGGAPVRQAVAQGFADAHAQRAADAADFQRVGQACVDMVVAGNRVHLGLAPEAAEGTGEDDAVVVLVEGAAPEFIGAVQGFAQAFAGEQGVPVQGAVSCGSMGIASGVRKGSARGKPVMTLSPASRLPQGLHMA